MSRDELSRIAAGSGLSDAPKDVNAQDPFPWISASPGRISNVSSVFEYPSVPLDQLQDGLFTAELVEGCRSRQNDLENLLLSCDPDSSGMFDGMEAGIRFGNLLDPGSFSVQLRTSADSLVALAHGEILTLQQSECRTPRGSTSLERPGKVRGQPCTFTVPTAIRDALVAFQGPIHLKTRRNA